MNKKILSTILLLAIAVGFLFWGLSMLFLPGDGETKVYSILILGCSLIAFGALVKLPRKKQQ